jgi:hypothetical protein
MMNSDIYISIWFNLSSYDCATSIYNSNIHYFFSSFLYSYFVTLHTWWTEFSFRMAIFWNIAPCSLVDNWLMFQRCLLPPSSGQWVSCVWKRWVTYRSRSDKAEAWMDQRLSEGGLEWVQTEQGCEWERGDNKAWPKGGGRARNMEVDRKCSVWNKDRKEQK